MAKKDYYDILGISRTASQSEIKKAYRRLARKYHPDINPGDRQAEERFKEIQAAYSILNDSEKRRNYDQFGRAEGPGFQDFEGFQGFGFEEPGRGFGGFGDIFSDLFGRTRSAPRAPRPRGGGDLEYQVSIPFLDAVNGTRTRISFSRDTACERCGGSGSVSSRIQKCPTCSGTGQVRQRQGNTTFAIPCPACGGSGQARAGDCPECAGSGKRQTVEKLTVRIPPGVDNGSRVRVASKGNAGESGGPPGNLFLVISVQLHPIFKRDGSNILCRVPVTISEAVLGARIEVPTLTGKAWLKIPQGTQSGQKFRLKGKGVPALRGGAAGDEIVEVHIVLPHVRDERSRELLREFAVLNPSNPREEMGLR